MWETNGFLEKDNGLKTAMEKLAGYIESIPAIYHGFSAEALFYKPATNKWSKLEILGHLIDSAINNLKRFTEIQFLPSPYFISSYQQDELVITNHYQQLPLEHLLSLWQSLNRQIIYVVERIPLRKLDTAINNGGGELHTLAWLVIDYVDHLEHHLRQINEQTAGTH